jgi:hypothetical protein
VKIELLHVPGCANLENARELLRSSFLELGLQEQVQEKEGAFPSPSILVDGTDVMGRPETISASCRLDVPTRERLVDALRSASTHKT